MQTDAVRIRQLSSADAELFQAIRLDALQSCPSAFGRTYEEEKSQPLSWFVEQTNTSSIFGAFHGAEPMAMAGFTIQQGHKKSHKGFLWGMYVRPNARNKGIGQLLLQTIINYASSRVEVIQLSVIDNNKHAEALYNKFGFIKYGIEKNALKEKGIYYDEILMTKILSSASNSNHDAI